MASVDYSVMTGSATMSSFSAYSANASGTILTESMINQLVDQQRNKLEVITIEKPKDGKTVRNYEFLIPHLELVNKGIDMKSLVFHQDTVELHTYTSYLHHALVVVVPTLYGDRDTKISATYTMADKPDTENLYPPDNYDEKTRFLIDVVGMMYGDAI